MLKAKMSTPEFNVLLAESRQRLSPKLIDALSAAFCLVMMGDGNLDLDEMKGFYRDIASDPQIEDLFRETFDRSFTHWAQQLKTNYSSAAPKALATLSAFRGEPIESNLIVRFAQKALTLDESLELGEEQALKSVCEALGLDHDLY